ncbi:helicase SNF2 [Variovorax boronicumulans]|uniref:helicase SNF2 n=1 Tax=Variovorax boronicumulans TaxID=436515 RepID=UPI003398C1C4
MKTTKLLFAAAVLSVFAVGASAEEYQGVLQFQSTASRAAVHADAIAAAHSVDPYAEGASAGVPVAIASATDRAAVHTQAVAAARAGDLYAEAASAGTAPRLSGTLARAAVHAEAVAVAHGIGSLGL